MNYSASASRSSSTTCSALSYSYKDPSVSCVCVFLRSVYVSNRIQFRISACVMLSEQLAVFIASSVMCGETVHPLPLLLWGALSHKRITYQ